MLNGLDLFSGIGGISLALQPWVRTVCYIEIEPYCQQVLRERIADGRLDDAPIWDDVTTFNAHPWMGAVDIISAGFPCQDISTAGRGMGLAGERSGLVREVYRLAEEIQPAFIFLENVPAICTRGGSDIIETFAVLGYECRWGILSAADVGAPHLRKRWWCLSHHAGVGCGSRGPWGFVDGLEGSAEQTLPLSDAPGSRNGRLPARRRPEGQGAVDANRDIETPAHADQARRQDGEGGVAPWDMARGRLPECGDRWPPEPDVVRVVHGPSKGLDGPAPAVRALGEGVIPACAREAFRRSSGL